MRKTVKAVIGCKTTEYVRLNSIASRVKEGMLTNASLFPGTAAAVNKLKNDQLLFEDYIANAKGNHAILSQRNEQSKIVYADLQTLLHPVNTIAAGNVATIDLSGFPCSTDPAPRPVPDKVIIKRIVKGDTDLTAKIFIESLKQRNLTYTVRFTTVAGASVNDPTWKTILQVYSSKKLILPDLTPEQYMYISVSASNTAGAGIYSDPKPFHVR